MHALVFGDDWFRVNDDVTDLFGGDLSILSRVPVEDRRVNGVARAEVADPIGRPDGARVGEVVCFLVVHV